MLDNDDMAVVDAASKVAVKGASEDENSAYPDNNLSRLLGTGGDEVDDTAACSPTLTSKTKTKTSQNPPYSIYVGWERWTIVGLVSCASIFRFVPSSLR